MKRKIGILIVILTIICIPIVWFYLLANISPGQFDYEYDVGNGNYALYRSSAHSIAISPKSGYTSETEIIPEKVVEVAWNNQYVIAKQYGMKRENPERTYEIPDETIENYWILDTENKERHGPFSYEEFLLKIQEFKLTDLELKPVRDYVE